MSIVLLLSAIVTAPWHGVRIVAVLWGLTGLLGAVYAVVVARRMRNQTAYRAVIEDWAFHVLIPLAAYVILAGAACLAYSHERPALFAVGAAVLLLLFTGIHNAWDAVMYHVFVRRRERDNPRQPEP